MNDKLIRQLNHEIADALAERSLVVQLQIPSRPFENPRLGGGAAVSLPHPGAAELHPGAGGLRPHSVPAQSLRP